jgi:hypothetical protein
MRTSKRVVQALQACVQGTGLIWASAPEVRARRAGHRKIAGRRSVRNRWRTLLHDNCHSHRHHLHHR